MLLNKNSH